MNISFIVPTYNEEKYLQNCLESIESQRCEKEIIIVDGGSDDRTLEIAELYADKVIREVEGRGKGRHQGAKEAENELLVFIDADTTVKEDFSEKIINFMDEKELAACATRFRMTGVRSKVIQIFGNTFFPRMKPPLLPGFNTVVRKSVYKKSNGFQDIVGEDLQFSKEISKYGRIGIHREKLAINSGRRIHRYGLAGTLIYYTWKDLKRRKQNIKTKNSFSTTDFIEIFSA